jgi:hypothetical protein
VATILGVGETMIKGIPAFLRRLAHRYYEGLSQVLGYMDSLDDAIAEGNIAQVKVVAANLRLAIRKMKKA